MKDFLLRVKDSIRPRTDSVIHESMLPKSGMSLTGGAGATSPTNRVDPRWKPYMKVVESEIGKLEQLLKVLTTPSDKLILTYRTVTGGRATQDQILEALTLRGLSASEMNRVVKAYNMTAGEKEQLSVKSTSELLVNSFGASVKSGWAGFLHDAKAKMHQLQLEAQKPA